MKITIRPAIVNDYPAVTELSVQLGYAVSEATMKTRLEVILIDELDVYMLRSTETPSSAGFTELII